MFQKMSSQIFPFQIFSLPIKYFPNKYFPKKTIPNNSVPINFLPRNYAPPDDIENFSFSSQIRNFMSNNYFQSLSHEV